MTRWNEVGRGLVVLAACFAAMASASSSQNTPEQPGAGGYAMSPPPPQAMAPAAALGLWMTSFGAVKIEEDVSRSPAGSGQLHGVWTYTDRNTQREVIGYFAGALRGNVLEFRWQEPSTPAPLVGSGYVAFDPMGRSFKGRWRTDTGDRVGDWDGWRQGASQSQPGPYGQQPSPYGQQPSPYGQQPYPAQPSPYGQQQPYPAQPSPYGQPQPQPYPAQPSPYGQPQPQPYPAQPSPYGQPQPQPQPYPAQPSPYSQPPPPQPRYY
jgi:hypothetical protein